MEVDRRELFLSEVNNRETIAVIEAKMTRIVSKTNKEVPVGRLIWLKLYG